MSQVHPIEVESYRILRSRIDLSDRPPLTRAVTERIIHATADFDYVTDLVCDEMALAAGADGVLGTGEQAGPAATALLGHR